MNCYYVQVPDNSISGLWDFFNFVRKCCYKYRPFCSSLQVAFMPYSIQLLDEIHLQLDEDYISLQETFLWIKVTFFLLLCWTWNIPSCKIPELWTMCSTLISLHVLYKYSSLMPSKDLNQLELLLTWTLLIKHQMISANVVRSKSQMIHFFRIFLSLEFLSLVGILQIMLKVGTETVWIALWDLSFTFINHFKNLLHFLGNL
jgi:hypothetical protein